MNRRSDSILLAERQAAEAWASALAEYEAARAKLRRRVATPLFIGGALLGGIALGYLALARGKPKFPVYPGNPGPWTQGVKTVQVLLPLLLALNSATRAARTPRAEKPA